MELIEATIIEDKDVDHCIISYLITVQDLKSNTNDCAIVVHAEIKRNKKHHCAELFLLPAAPSPPDVGRGSTIKPVKYYRYARRLNYPARP